MYVLNVTVRMSRTREELRLGARAGGVILSWATGIANAIADEPREQAFAMLLYLEPTTALRCQWPKHVILSLTATPAPDPQQANILYVAITRAKQLLVLSPRFGKQLSRLGMWDSLSLRGEPSDATVPLARRCSWCVNDVEEDAAGVTETVFARRGFLYTGSGSSKPVCAACLDGEGGDAGVGGVFPYASELLLGAARDPPAEI